MKVYLRVLCIISPLLALLPLFQLAAKLMNGGSAAFYLGLVLLILFPMVAIQVVYREVRSLVRHFKGELQ